jgi:hypothetical protein
MEVAKHGKGGQRCSGGAGPIWTPEPELRRRAPRGSTPPVHALLGYLFFFRLLCFAWTRQPSQRRVQSMPRWNHQGHVGRTSQVFDQVTTQRHGTFSFFLSRF